ncbi:hypothetical protein INP83_10845 [Mucilaginibacter sp. 21P]|uniref:hypothetical protein n=1 Tax=Mucilaginibacter sp. 21P TaxID=2778902 RepID=UPI001C57F1E4|nr:hypothetical protein [Mucilaginibacter sp. 21P]QXV63615.1 hypothetical protein INP83_10845 [Mucilaginibacter sp. 21P]
MRLGWLLILLPYKVMAQGDYDKIRFDIIKETVNFLATDPKISTLKDFHVKCSKPDYQCLEANINDKKLRGVLQRVRGWDNKKENNGREDILRLKERIWKDIIDAPGKEYRRALPDYGAYVKKIDQLLRGIAITPGRAAQSPVPRTELKTRPATLGVVPDKVDEQELSDSPGQKNTEMVKENDNTTNKEVDFMDDKMSLFAIVTSLTAILISFLALFRKAPKVKAPAVPAPPVQLYADVAETRRLQQEFVKVNQLLEQNDQLCKLLEKRLIELESQNVTYVFDVARSKPELENVDTPVILSQEPPIQNLTRYAKFSDLDQRGFSSAMLKEKQNGEQTYEITIYGDEATFVVSDDTGAQRYALQNYEYLSGACIFNNQPQGSSRIETLVPGRLVRTSDENWVFGDRAHIQFSR